MANTIQITGTGGIIEGNLGTANVNVNLDAALDFDGSNDIVDLNYGSGVNAQAGFSVAFWAKLDDNFSGTNQMFIGSSTGTNQRFYIGNDGLRWSFGYASSGWSEAGSQTAFAGAWHHVCVTATSGAQKLYVNGVEITAQAKTDSSTFTLASDLGAGAMFGGAYYSNGTMADIKIFGDVLTAAEVQELASKINYDISAGSIDNLTRWFKSNAGSGTTIADDSGNSGTAADISGATWIYDQYSVDVYDNSTTTDGTFTVTQGKVEGLALSSVELNGSDDFININNPLESWTESAQKTFALWVYNDGNASETRIFNTGFEDAGSKTAFALGLSFGTANRPFYFIRDTSAGSLKAQFGEVHPTSTWMHYVIVQDGANDKAYLYQNGVLQETVSSVGEINATTSTSAKIGRHWDSSGNFFDGKLRDLRLYDYDFSDEQVASLYSATYPQTPLHHWKLDEGYTSGTTANTAGAFEDSGTGTDYDAQGSGLVNASCVNGTLNLDSTLTIQANGTLSAPRGNLDVGGNMASSGALTHNNGKVRFTEHLQVTGTSLTFYNMSWDGSNTKTIDLMNDTTIENELDGNNQWRLKASSNTVTLTMGTATSQGTIDTTGMSSYGLEWDSNTSNFVKIKGVNSLFPAIITGTNIDWDDVSSGLVRLENCDFQGDITTGGGGVTITLTGDCEFDAVTVSSGDTLDLNGQRMECSGTLTNNGEIDFDGMIYAPDLNLDGTTTNKSSGTVVLQPTSAVGALDLRDDATLGTLMINAGTNRVNIAGTNNAASATNLFVGSGILDLASKVMNYTDMNVATGGTLDADSSTINVAGDFTTSGGLIGKSALNLTGSEEVTGTDNLDEVATSNRVTVEAWFKATTDANYRAIFSRGTSWATGNIYMYMNSAGNIQFSMNDLGATVTSTTAGLADGKWHHAAATYDQTNLKLYIDGKLEASSAYTNTLNTQSNGFKIGDRNGDNWQGQIGRVSIWDAALTEAQIREMLFYDFATADSEGTIPDANCIGWWQFDEGTGTAVADSSTNNADGTLNSAAWAGAGTFTMGTSTVDLTGNGEWAVSDYTTDYYNVKVAASGKTTTIRSVGGSEKRPRINNLLTHGGGTLTDIGNADITFYGTGTHTAGADLSGLYITYWPSSTDMPGGTYQYLITQHNDLSTTGNINCGGYFAVSSDDGFDLKNHTLTTGRMILYANSTFNMDAGSLIFDSTSGLTGDYDGRTFTAGPGAIISGVAAKSGFFSENNYEVVGDITNLDVTNEELTVIGTVTNCTGDIIQFTPGHDTTLSLETDTAEDRDIRLGGPSLDNANHLVPE